MTAPIVNASSIPLTGNAVVTQGSESDLADPAKSLARPGFFLLDLRSQSPPGATSDAADDSANGTALPTGGNFLPLLLQSLWRQQPDPTTFPPSADTGAAPGATPSVAAPASDPPPVAAPSPEPGSAEPAIIFEPALLAARKVFELLRSPVPAGAAAASDVAVITSAAAPAPAANPVAEAMALPAALIAQAAQIPPDMLAALVKRVTQSAAPVDVPPAGTEATAPVPLVQATSGGTGSSASTADDIKQWIDSLPRHTPVEQILVAARDASTNKSQSDALSAAIFVDADALRAHGANTQRTDAPAQTLRLDVPMRSPEWGQALGERITWLVDQNLSAAQIKLNPPQLGPIEVHIALSGDSTRVSVTAHNMITRDALEAAAPRLREALEAHGLGNVSVDISQHSFTDRGLPQSRADAFAPWQSPGPQATASLATTTQYLRVPGRLDAYA